MWNKPKEINPNNNSWEQIQNLQDIWSSKTIKDIIESISQKTWNIQKWVWTTSHFEEVDYDQEESNNLLLRTAEIPDYNQEEVRELFIKISSLNKKITIITNTLPWEIDWWYVERMIKYFKDVSTKYEDDWEFLAWYILTWDCSRLWWEKHLDFPWEDSVVMFLERCITELNTMLNTI